MIPTAATPTGFLSAFRALADGLLAAAHGRFELFAVELQEEKLRLIQTVIWITAALFTAVLVVMFASLTVVCIFWETARLTALGTLTAFYAAALVAIIISFRRFLARQPKPFADTLSELKTDRSCIPDGN
ncbi:MAG: phage holin family protein [Opitutus sp.]